MENLMKIYYESLVIQQKIWNSLLGTADNGRKKLNNSNWSVQEGGYGNWRINHNGTQVGNVCKDIATREEAITAWRVMNDEDGNNLQERAPLRVGFNANHEQGFTGDDGPGDDVECPDHYTVGGFEAIEIIRAKLTTEQYIGYCKGNILKYVMRANYKGSHDQDCAKLQYYTYELLEAIADGKEEEGHWFDNNPPF